MKLRFKHQANQADAVRAVVDCFQGQPPSTGLGYAVDPGAASPMGFVPLPGTELEGFANAALVVPPAAILKNLQEIQREQRIPVSDSLKVTDVSASCRRPSSSPRRSATTTRTGPSPSSRAR